MKLSVTSTVFCCLQAFFLVLVAVAAPDWREPRRGPGGEVCGSVCHPAGGTAHCLGPLGTFGGPEPLTGKRQHI